MGVGAGIAVGAGGKTISDFLSRPSPAQPSTRPSVEQPVAGQPTTRPSPGERPTAGQLPSNRPVAGQLPSSRPSRIENVEGRHSWRQQRHAHIQDHVNRLPNRLQFWADNPRWARWRFTRPYRWATWGAITSWFPWGWNHPVYYSYGDNIYYEGDNVYYNNEVIATTTEYSQQAQDLAGGVPEDIPDDTEWMSLGVFAVTQDDQSSGVDPTIFLQLAVNKGGILAGTVHNSETDKTESVEGMVDKETQRSAWLISGKTSPIMESSISNLTKDDAPALLHFADGQTQQWLLVRLEEPQEEQAAGSP